ncbi:hypothetical protein B0H66DRAFT_557099 [Apodospora peruviana]|uniref:polynucleotide adenylyltransferase n=1 Tax=Apodospora peruviana TaxID=516989 RepID=A0AAE0I4E3_9PEZI|nr:hypothetical protein B0H66DRAFT_557099 [Apodospora peruviana]
MENNQQQNLAHGAGLEHRLRNLILNHSDRDQDIQSSQGPVPNFAQNAPTPTSFSTGASSHMDGRSSGSQGNSASALPPSSSSGSRRRLNQAQRRQMSAQLSIPIDPRPPAAQNQMPQSARSYASPPGYPHHQYTHSGQYRNQRPHSATFRPGSRGNTLTNAPLTGTPFLSHPRHHQSLSYHGPMSPLGDHDWRQHAQHNGEAPATPSDASSPRNSRPSNASLYNPGRQYHTRPEDLKSQTDMLDGLCRTIIAGTEIESADIIEKENFRAMIEQVARSVIWQYEKEQNGIVDFPPASVQLRCFGSLSSGFATKAADMDLGLLSPLSHVQPDAPDSPIPRLVEKAFLDIGLGARLLTRTRVPIIKVCEKPPAQLRADLLQERAKWERGVEDEIDIDGVPEEPDMPAIEDVQSHDHKQDNHGQGSQNLSRDSATAENRFHSLKQGKKSLQNYYINAKTLLRQLGGRDLTNSNAAEFGKEDFEFLNDFSIAFVEGLEDEELRKRLLGYKSLSRYDLAAKSYRRTLYGVHTQIEGEKLVMMWESRQIKEKDDHQEQQGQSWVTMWNNLQNKSTYGVDPLNYNKELQLALEQLRRIPSIQVLLLSQNQNESVSTYHNRAIKVMLELGCHDTPTNESPVLPLVIRHYIKGILSEKIRDQVEKFASSRNPMTLCAVAIRHKSLQLALDYERCLEKGAYPDRSVEHIRAYIDILRRPMTVSKQTPHLLRFAIPVTPATSSIISEIRLLGDPSKMGPNLPRDPYRDRLEFPKSGVGVQCDINFSAHLALQNTLLLRCYSHCDPRVRPLVLFVKHWAKVRHINSPYRGTLSSYGYVLMMLHYLVNVAQPFVCPNLQLLAPGPDPNLPSDQAEEATMCKGRNIRFWRDEAEIQRLARENVLNQNRDSLGHLLRGFFEYYAHSNSLSTVQGRGFDWGRDVLSLRSPGGLLSKQEKGWTGAKTVVEEVNSMAAPQPLAPTTKLSTESGQDRAGGVLQQHQAIVQSPQGVTVGQPNIPLPVTAPPGGHNTREVKEVRYRYLFAIEDPFELEHNVARTVTHNGIVSIRDEFRRAWRIIKGVGKGGGAAEQNEELLQDLGVAEELRDREEFSQLLDELHGV